MKLIPPTITDLASSKKSVTFWVMLGLWLPVSREYTGLTDPQLMWLTVGFIGYAIGQGLADFGKGSAQTQANAAAAAASKAKKK